MISITHIIGILLTVGVLVAISVASGRNVKDAASFMTGGRSGSWMVCGAILGTLVGGQSTIGTAQLAFTFGLSAWWFTIGAALGALVLGLVYAGPLRRSGQSTLMEVVRKEYGKQAEAVGSILFLIGIFISITSQLLSSSAMIGSLFGIQTILTIVIGAVLIAVQVLFGGIKSAGAGGIVKLVLLYVSSIAAGVFVWHLGDGFSGILSSIDMMFQNDQIAGLSGITSAEDVHNRYGSFLARGALKDLGGCLSMILGVVSTQTYAQAIWSAASTEKARRGAVYCAVLIPFIGGACTMVGMYMRGHYITVAEQQALLAAGETLPEGIRILENSLQAFPTFVLAHMPAWLGGIALGTMLVNILGSGSGLVLGAATIMTRDIFHRSSLPLTRWCIIFLLIASSTAAHFMSGAFINDLGFLSLGLRAAALLLPLSCALWLPGRISSRAVTLSMILGTAVMILAALLSLPADPIYYGVAASAATLVLSYFIR